MKHVFVAGLVTGDLFKNLLQVTLKFIYFLFIFVFSKEKLVPLISIGNLSQNEISSRIIVLYVYTKKILVSTFVS